MKHLASKKPYMRPLVGLHPLETLPDLWDIFATDFPNHMESEPSERFLAKKLSSLASNASKLSCVLAKNFAPLVNNTSKAPRILAEEVEILSRNASKVLHISMDAIVTCSECVYWVNFLYSTRISYSNYIFWRPQLGVIFASMMAGWSSRGWTFIVGPAIPASASLPRSMP